MIIGRRVPLTEDGSIPVLQPGDFCKAKDGTFYVCTPNGHQGWLKKHDIVEHEDGTITVSPSILVEIGDGKGGWAEGWHGYLEKGIWRVC